MFVCLPLEPVPSIVFPCLAINVLRKSKITISSQCYKSMKQSSSICPSQRGDLSSPSAKGKEDSILLRTRQRNMRVWESL